MEMSASQRLCRGFSKIPLAEKYYASLRKPITLKTTIEVASVCSYHFEAPFIQQDILLLVQMQLIFTVFISKSYFPVLERHVSVWQ